MLFCAVLRLFPRHQRTLHTQVLKDTVMVFPPHCASGIKRRNHGQGGLRAEAGLTEPILLLPAHLQALRLLHEYTHKYRLITGGKHLHPYSSQRGPDTSLASPRTGAVLRFPQLWLHPCFCNGPHLSLSKQTGVMWKASPSPLLFPL